MISNTGVVSRPLTGDATVTLTATITMSPASDTKTFPVTVKAQMTDADAAAAAKAALTISYASGDSATSVTRNVTLPATGLDNSTIGWASTNAAVITNAGVVSQPPTGNTEVTLTATIIVGSASNTKQFLLVVKPQMTDAQAVAAAKAALTIGYNPGDADTTVTQNLTLPTSGLYGHRLLVVQRSGNFLRWDSDAPAHRRSACHTHCEHLTPSRPRYPRFHRDRESADGRRPSRCGRQSRPADWL